MCEDEETHSQIYKYINLLYSVSHFAIVMMLRLR